MINCLQVSQKIIDTGQDFNLGFIDSDDGQLQQTVLSRYISEAISPQSMIRHFIEGFNIWTGEYIEPIRKPERPDISSFDDPADPAFDEQCDIITLETDYDKKIDDSNVQFITIDETYRQRMDEDNRQIEKGPSALEILMSEHNAVPIDNDNINELVLDIQTDDENEKRAALFFAQMNLRLIETDLRFRHGQLSFVRAALPCELAELSAADF